MVIMIALPTLIQDTLKIHILASKKVELPGTVAMAIEISEEARVQRQVGCLIQGKKYSWEIHRRTEVQSLLDVYYHHLSIDVYDLSINVECFSID